MTGRSIRHYLLVFDHDRSELIEQFDLGTDSAAAVAAYEAKEREFASRRSIEVVLIGSDSLDTIRRTHANYFGGAVAASNKYFAGI